MHTPFVAATLIGIGLGLALVSAGLLVRVWRNRRRARGIGLPGHPTARVVASDTGVAPSLLLRDDRLGLSGKPDYLLAEGRGDQVRITPLEIKPTRRASHLYESDELQLGVYLVLTRTAYGDRAAGHGYVQYAASTFRVQLTTALEQRIARVVTSIRAGRGAAVVHRSHDVPAKCAGCAMRVHCDESLV
jgi:CRISPR/Cas system-associated exonuclease Cas4 (RecB family)